MGIESIYLRYPQVFSRLHTHRPFTNKHTPSKTVLNFSESIIGTDQLNLFAPYSQKLDTDGDNFLPGFQDGYVRDSLDCKESLGLADIAVSTPEYKHFHQGFRMCRPSNICCCSPHLTLSIKKNKDILCSDTKLYCQPFVSYEKKCRPQDTLSMLRDQGIQQAQDNDTVCTAANDYDTEWLKNMDTADHCWCNTDAANYCWKDAVLTSHMELGSSEKSQTTVNPECDGTRGGDVQVTTTVTMLDGNPRYLPPGFADRRGGWVSQVDATVSPFSGAISWMHAPLGPATWSVSQRAHEESQRAYPCVECQRLPLASLDGRLRSLPADHTVQQVSKAENRVTREVTAKRSRPRTQAAGRHVAVVDPPYLCDLEDDTDPSRGYAPEVGGGGHGTGPRKKRVYLIKRPRCSPLFGSVTLLVRKSSEIAAGGKGDRLQTKAALAGSAEGRRSSTLVHFSENEDGIRGAVQRGECPENDILLSCVSTRDRLQNEQEEPKKDGSGDSKEITATATVAATEAGAASAVETANEGLLHKRAACEGCSVHVTGDVASRDVCDPGNVTRHQLETERQQLEPPRPPDREVNDLGPASSEPKGDVQVSGRVPAFLPVFGSGESLPGGNELAPGNESVQERDKSIPRSESVHRSDELVHGSDKIVPGSDKTVPGSDEIVHGSEETVHGNKETVSGRESVYGIDLSVPNEQETPGKGGDLGRTFCDFASTALSSSTPLPRWDLEENYSPPLDERTSVWSSSASNDAIACNSDKRDGTCDLRQEKKDHRSRWKLVESKRILPTEDTPTHEHHFSERELSPSLGSTVFKFSDSVNSEGGEANYSCLSCDSFSVRNKGQSNQFCSRKESKHSLDENDEKQDPLLGKFSGPTSDLTPEEGTKKILETMFGSKKGKYNFGETKSRSTEASDQTEEDASSLLCTPVPRNPYSGSSTRARQRCSLNERPASVGKEQGKVRNKAIYSRFFSDSGADIEDKSPPGKPSVGSLQGGELVQRSRSKDVQRKGSFDGSCVSRTPTPLFVVSCMTGDSVSGTCKGPASAGSRQSFSHSSFSDRETTDREVCLVSQDVETSPTPTGKRKDKHGGAKKKKKSVKGRLAKKKKNSCAVKSYDFSSEGGTGGRRFQSWGLPYEPDSESDSSDSTTDDDNNEYAAGFWCRGENSQSTDGKRRVPVSQQEAGSKGHRTSSTEEVLSSETSAKMTTALSTTSPPPPAPQTVAGEKEFELQSLQSKTELSGLAAISCEDSQANDSKEQRLEPADAAAHATKLKAGWQQILSNRYAAIDHMTAEEARSREPKTATSEATKTDITTPDDGLAVQCAKKDHQESSQILLAGAAQSTVVEKEDEDDLTPITTKRAPESVISYNLTKPVKRPDAGASVDESSGTRESSVHRSRDGWPMSGGNFSDSSGPNGTPVAAGAGPYETALARVQGEDADSQLTVVTPLAEPLLVSTSTPSSDEVTVTESESEASLSPLASALDDVMESEIYVIPRDALSESDYEFIFAPSPRLARFGRAQSAPGKPPRTTIESHTPSAASRSMSLDAARSATLRVARDRIYDVPPRRLPLKFPVESNRPGSVLFHDLTRASVTDSSFTSSSKQQQPQRLHQLIPDDENPYVNDAGEVSQPTTGGNSVWDETQKTAESRRSRLQRTHNTCSLAEGHKTDSQPSSRESSGHPFDVEAVVTEDNSDLEGTFDEDVVYANSIAVQWSQKATQNERTKLSTACQKDLFIETSPEVSGESDYRAQSRGQTTQKVITQTGSHEYHQRKKEKGKRESKRPGLGREGGKEPSSENSGVVRCEEPGHAERSIRSGTPGSTGQRQMSDQGTSEVQATALLGVASPDGSSREVERRDSDGGWSEASQQEADSIDGEETEKETCWEEQDETLKLNPQPSGSSEVTVRSSTYTHTHQHHSDLGVDTGYEDVHVGGQRTTDQPVALAPTVPVRDADAESSPVPETSYVTKQKKYNEYSNVIRIDSERLKAARAKSSSTVALFTVTNGSSALSAGSSPLRNAISLEDGLNSGERKKKKKKNPKQPDEDGSLRKHRRHFSFQKLLSLFRKKRKKKRTENMPEEEAQGETTGAAGVQTSNKFFNMRKILKIMKKPKAEQTAMVSSTQDINRIRPIGRLLQLNADGTQLVELIRPQDESLGIVLTTGSDEENGIFVSGFTDNSLEKLLAGVLNVGDQIIKVNERSIRATSLDSIHNMITGQQRIKLLTLPMQGK